LDITWYGHSCFRITERNRISVVTDPFSENIGLPVPRLKADVVTISHNEPGHNNVSVVKGTPHVLTGAGEYEIGGVFITGIAMHYVVQDAMRYNIAFRFAYDSGLTVLHLGDLAHIPDHSTVENFGEVNVLLLPVGGGNSLRASQAAEIVALIEPHFIIPMHYGMPEVNLALEPIDKFLKAMGVSTVQEADALRVTTGELPEQSQVIILKPQASAQA
jgi:L-ascorbate metabolism protein UlaG (beta-lactamase superfamily)